MLNTSNLKLHPIFELSFQFIIENNKSTNNPYHSTYHLLGVFNTAMDIVKTLSLPTSDILNLGVACLFHDMNHSGGKHGDDVNIPHANISVGDFYYINKKYIDENNVDIDINIISDLIWSTEFPRTNEPKNILEEIIMDSDMIQCYDVNWFLTVVKGIATEWNKDIKSQIDGQVIFINTVVYYTEYATRLHSENKDRILKELEYLKTIF